MALEGMDITEARGRNGLFNTGGLVVTSRSDLRDFQKPFAQDRGPVSTFVDAIKTLKPTGIIGVSTPQSRILEASLHVARRIAEYIFDKQLARVPRPDDIQAHIRACAYRPVYLP